MNEANNTSSELFTIVRELTTPQLVIDLFQKVCHDLQSFFFRKIEDIQAVIAYTPLPSIGTCSESTNYRCSSYFKVFRQVSPKEVEKMI